MKSFRRFYLTKVFVEWRENSTDKFSLSLIPIHVYVDGLLGKWFNPNFNFEFHLVPGWRIKVAKN